MRFSMLNKVKYTIWLLLGISLISFCASVSLATELLDEQKESLAVIADFADRLCKDIPLEGSGENIDLSIEAKAELDDLIKKLVNLGAVGAGKYQKTEYQGLLQSDLAKVLKDSTQCKLEIFKALKDELLVKGDSQVEPKILLFEFRPQVIKKGESTTLEWEVRDASSVVINVDAIGSVALRGKRTVTPKRSGSITLTASRGGITRKAKANITVKQLTKEDEHSVGTLPGDGIYHFRVVNYARDHFVAEVSYHYNPQHGQVFIGGYLMDANENCISHGFRPASAPSTGKAIVNVNVDPSKGYIRSKWVLFWLYEANKGAGFISRRFVYENNWNW